MKAELQLTLESHRTEVGACYTDEHHSYLGIATPEQFEGAASAVAAGALSETARARIADIQAGLAA